MAELLIYNKDHWMDALSQEDIDKRIQNYPDNVLDEQGGGVVNWQIQ